MNYTKLNKYLLVNYHLVLDSSVHCTQCAMRYVVRYLMCHGEVIWIMVSWTFIKLISASHCMLSLCTNLVMLILCGIFICDVSLWNQIKQKC